MNRIRVLAISPYPELADLFSRIAGEFEGIELYHFSGSPREAENYVRAFPHTALDAIISRGGTAARIRSEFNIPVISVEFSIYDILCALQSSQLSGEPFAVVGYHALVEPCCRCRDILHLDFPIFEVRSDDDLSSILEEITKQGIHLLVGDVSAYARSNALGLNYILVASGAESVREAFHTVWTICSAVQRSIRDSMVFRSVVESSPSDIFIFHEDGSVLYSKQTYSYFEPHALQNFLRGFLEMFQKRCSFSLYKKYQGYLLNLHCSTLPNYSETCYVFYVSVCSLSGSTNAFLHIENPSEVEASGNFIFNNREYLRPLFPQLDSLAKSSLPLIIYGSEGSGKTSVARYIHLNSSARNSPFISIRCNLLTELLWDSLIDNPKSPLYDKNCTIYFKNIHTLPMSLQQKIDAFLDDSLLSRRNRIISSSIYYIPDLVATNNFSHSLYLHLYDASINIPTLAERGEDIPGIINLCTSYYNNCYSKHVIGFEPAALELLISNCKGLNFEQMQKIIKQLVITAKGFYIDEKDVVTASRSIVPRFSDAGKSAVPMNGTLEEIEREIIDRVLTEEGMNQTAAAKRLGISRSTMWRKQGKNLK